MNEFLLEVLGEALLQIVLEVVAEVGLHRVPTPFRKPLNPWLAATGYAILGAGAGVVSLWLLPSILVTGKALRVLNLIVTPVAVGLLMGALGAWRSRRGQVSIRLDRFACGYLFALSLALVRFGFAG